MDLKTIIYTSFTIRVNLMNNDKLIWLTLLVFVLVGVSFDLYTTELGLSIGLVETRPFGNHPEIYYPRMVFMVSLIFWLGKYLSIKHDSSLFSIGIMSSIILSLTPYLAIYQNVTLINSVLRLI
jgi:hypothetical protein